MQAIISYSYIEDIASVDTLMVFRVTPWTILFPFLRALGASNPLLQAVDEVCIILLI
jgi:hypothetical protein